MTRRLKTVVLDIPDDVMLPVKEIAKLAGLSPNTIIRVALATEVHRDAQKNTSLPEDTKLIAKMAGLMGEALATLWNCPVEQLTMDQLNDLPAAVARMKQTLEEQRTINQQLIADVDAMEELFKTTMAELRGIYTAKFEQAANAAQVAIGNRQKRTKRGRA